MCIHLKDSMYQLSGQRNADSGALYDQDFKIMADHGKNVKPLETWGQSNEA
jgi:hypothetical protein